MVKLSLICTLAKLGFMDLGVFEFDLNWVFVGELDALRCYKSENCCIVLNLSLN